MAIYPSGTSTDADLYVAVDNIHPTLNGGINAVQTTITLSSTSGLPTVGILTIENEKIKYTGIAGSDITGVTRGFSSTTAAVHGNGTAVKLMVVEEHHNLLKDEIIALETDLRNAISGDLNDAVSPASTAANIKTRLDHIVTQLKLIIGTGDWKDAITDDLADIAAKASTALSNLAAVAINTSLISDTSNTDDLGSLAIPWRSAYLKTSLILEETGAGTDAITIHAPSSLTTPWDFTLPPNDGTPGQVLTTDGSGVTTWETPSGGSPTFPLLADDGTVTNPSYSFTNSTGSGLFYDSGDDNSVKLVQEGVSQLSVGDSGMILSPNLSELLVQANLRLDGYDIHLQDNGAIYMNTNSDASFIFDQGGSPSAFVFNDGGSDEIYLQGVNSSGLFLRSSSSNETEVRIANAIFDVRIGGSARLRVTSPAAGQTALHVFDFDNNTVERVTVGAADSGGVGFKVLRIPN